MPEYLSKVKLLVACCTFFLLVGCLSALKPQVGTSALAGQVTVYVSNDWNLFSEGLQNTPLRIRVKNVTTGERFWVKTNSDGMFFIPNVSPGEYALAIWEINKSGGNQSSKLNDFINNIKVVAVEGEVAFFKSVKGVVHLESADSIEFESKSDEADIDKLSAFIKENYPEWSNYLFNENV